MPQSLEVDDELSALYPGARITKNVSDAKIAEFLCRANLNDAMKKEFNKVLQYHVPQSVKLRQDYLPQNAPKFKVQETDVDRFILLPLPDQIEAILKRLGKAKETAKQVVAFIDGGARYKKGTDSFWPFLAFLHPENMNEYKEVVKKENIIIVGLSKKKPMCPKPSTEFIKSCCSALEAYGLSIKNVTADVPARSFALAHVAFNSLSGCTFCKAKGERCNGRTLWRYEAALSADLKTEDTFRSQTDGVLAQSPFQNVQRPDGFRVDIMHQLGAGITKRLLQLLLRGVEIKNTGHQLSPSAKRAVFEELESVKLPRSLPLSRTDLTLSGSWKAKTCLYFFIHLVPIFRPFVSFKKLRSLLILGNLIYLYASEFHLSVATLAHIELLNSAFCMEFEETWGKSECTYNFHMCHHLVNQTISEAVSPMTYSAFPFESFMHCLMNSMHGTIGSLEQSARNIFFRVRVNAEKCQTGEPNRWKSSFMTRAHDTAFLSNSYGFNCHSKRFFTVDAIHSDSLIGTLLETRPLLSLGQSHFCNFHKILRRSEFQGEFPQESCVLAVVAGDHISPVVKFTFM